MFHIHVPQIRNISCHVLTLKLWFIVSVGTFSCRVGYGDICPSEDMAHEGRLFIILISFFGLGMFCGPVMDFAASWPKLVPGGVLGAAIPTLGLGVGLFTQIEGMSHVEAMYFSIVTGTTIGYGDIGPKTDEGKIATALYAVLVVNVMGALLEPARNFLSQFCSTKRIDDVSEKSVSDPPTKIAATSKKQNKAGRKATKKED
mmetsp:Transcript_17637/g.51349  ORF Transcript_17637/g.51349 Transcript_17637/m.51349 type:complete len:202 (-) Transcript_17637:136-741(-)